VILDLMELIPMRTFLAQPPLWHVCGIFVFLALAAVQRRARRSGIFLLALWNLIGVVLHEFAHLLVGTVLRAGPAGFSLLPHREGRYWRLGSVSFARITPLNAVPVALAPLGLAGVAYWSARNWFDWNRPSLPATLALYVALYILLYNALPSRQDLRVACNWRSLVLYSLVAGVVCCYVWQEPIAITGMGQSPVTRFLRPLRVTASYP
jgi:hypothetical protein